MSDAPLRLSSTEQLWLPEEATAHPLSGRLVVQPATVLIILSPKLLPDALSICVTITKKAQKILVRMSVNVWGIFYKVL